MKPIVVTCYGAERLGELIRLLNQLGCEWQMSSSGQPIATDDPRSYGAATSMTRTSKPMKFWKDNGYLQGSILDFGCGHEDYGHDRYDPFHAADTKPLLTKRDTVLCNYVLNVQPSDHLITLICCLLSKLVGDTGKVLIAVRNDLDGDSDSIRGHQRGKTSQQWQALIGDFFWVEELTTDGFFGFLCTPIRP